MNDQIADAIQYNQNEEPIVISKPTSDRLLKLERPADAMALYWFYYYTAKWQHNSTPHASNIYVMNGLKWSEGRLAQAKRELVKLGLVKTVRIRLPGSNQFGKPAIKINFIHWKPQQEQDAIPPNSPYPQKSHDMANDGQRRSTIIRERRITNSPTEERSDDVCWIQLATFLAKVVRSHRKIVTSAPKVKTWAREIRKLFTVEKVPLADIQCAMKWYINNAYSNQFVPIIECGMTFRDKYTKILAAMERDKGTPSATQHTSDDDDMPGYKGKGSELTFDEEDNV